MSKKTDAPTDETATPTQQARRGRRKEATDDADKMPPKPRATRKSVVPDSGTDTTAGATAAEPALPPRVRAPRQARPATPPDSAATTRVAPPTPRAPARAPRGTMTDPATTPVAMPGSGDPGTAESPAPQPAGSSLSTPSDPATHPVAVAASSRAASPVPAQRTPATAVAPAAERPSTPAPLAVPPTRSGTTRPATTQPADVTAPGDASRTRATNPGGTEPLRSPAAAPAPPSARSTPAPATSAAAALPSTAPARAPGPPPRPAAGPTPSAPPEPTSARPAEPGNALPPFLRTAGKPAAAPATPAASARSGGKPASRGKSADTPVHPADASARSRCVLEALLKLLPKPWRPATRDYLVLMRMDRPIGALLLLWPTWWALWLASGDFPPPHLLVIFTLGVFLMRAAGCVINDYADRWLDPQVERTRGRPIAAGRVSPRAALVLFGLLLALAFGLVLLTNTMTVMLSFAGAALATLYPFAKRYTHLPQVVLGAAFGWSIPMAFAAVNGGAPTATWLQALPPLCWLLFVANVVWATIYDTEYAMVDRDEDIAAGSRSTAILFGDDDRMILGVLMGTLLMALVLVGTRANLHWSYYLGVVAAAGLCVWQQYLIRDRDRAACFAAFRNNLWLGMAVWASICLALALKPI